VDTGSAGPVPLKVAVLKLHPGLAVRLAGERDLELTGACGVGSRNQVSSFALICQDTTIRCGGSQTSTRPQSHSLPSTPRS
jgi:hypothetical protein